MGQCFSKKETPEQKRIRIRDEKWEKRRKDIYKKYKKEKNK